MRGQLAIFAILELASVWAAHARNDAANCWKPEGDEQTGVHQICFSPNGFVSFTNCDLCNSSVPGGFVEAQMECLQYAKSKEAVDFNIELPSSALSWFVPDKALLAKLAAKSKRYVDIPVDSQRTLSIRGAVSMGDRFACHGILSTNEEELEIGGKDCPLLTRWTRVDQPSNLLKGVCQSSPRH